MPPNEAGFEFDCLVIIARNEYKELTEQPIPRQVDVASIFDAGNILEVHLERDHGREVDVWTGKLTHL